MRLSFFDYQLPEELIAQHPAPRRPDSRLLVLRRDGLPEHRGFPEVTDLLRPGDLLVRNDTLVIPARLIGRRASGGRVELLLLRPLAGAARWSAMIRPGKAVRPGSRLIFEEVAAEVEEKHPDGTVTVAFPLREDVFQKWLSGAGRMPLPPYIRRADDESAAVLEEDRRRYQTVYARQAGAVAAPTAGLHFTEEIFAALREKGVAIADLTLHVGAGTFLPVRTESLEDHVMHAEDFSLSEETARAVNACRDRGGRVVALGTTTARVLEAAGASGEPLTADAGSTDLFIKPGHRWRVVEALITNFHLPKSTLLVLVCALAGTDRLLAAYREAVARRYRFFSYGDACFLERAEDRNASLKKGRA